REFMPPLDEGSILDMPVTVPRVSIAQAADDIRVRDAVMRGFPEVDQVVGKVGRADTPTDPSGIDMVETVVTLRPRERWPKRKVQFNDALAEARQAVAALQQNGHLPGDLKPDDADALANAATMDGLAALDRVLRTLAHDRQRQFEPVLAQKLAMATATELLDVFRRKGALRRAATDAELTLWWRGWRTRTAGCSSRCHGGKN
ncbi:MAG TPA: efflux RND transporter permease subunit, partial [Phycisphaerae bacterium]|nr:efflux RND transporter permease subunit [Phycisphaerae bacterium]